MPRVTYNMGTSPYGHRNSKVTSPLRSPLLVSKWYSTVQRLMSLLPSSVEDHISEVYYICIHVYVTLTSTTIIFLALPSFACIDAIKVYILCVLSCVVSPIVYISPLNLIFYILCTSSYNTVGSIRTHPSTSPRIGPRRRRQGRRSESKTLDDSKQTANWGRSLRVINEEVGTGGQCSMWVWRARTDSWPHHQQLLPTISTTIWSWPLRSWPEHGYNGLSWQYVMMIYEISRNSADRIALISHPSSSLFLFLSLSSNEIPLLIQLLIQALLFCQF